MQVVLLAAGLGSRLGPLTTALPKALVQVGQETLVSHGIRFARLAGAREIVIVGGFGYDDLAAEVERIRGSVPGLPPLALVQNTEFRAGNLISLQAARPRIEGEFLLINVDHIYRPAIAALAGRPATQITAFIDTDRVLGADDMKVLRDGEGRIARIAKTLNGWDCGYVGMTRVPGDEVPRYFAEADRALAEEGRTIHVERILARLAGGPRPPLVRDISGHGWLEVDTPDERDRAEEALHGDGWR